MTKSQKQEAAHHNAAAGPAQKADHRNAQKPPPRESIQAVGAEGPSTEPEALAPVQPRAPPCKMLRFVDVIDRTGLSRTTIWRRVKAATFPAPISLGENSVGWPEHLIAEWVESRPVVRYAPDHEASAA